MQQNEYFKWKILVIKYWQSHQSHSNAKYQILIYLILQTLGVKWDVCMNKKAKN